MIQRQKKYYFLWNWREQRNLAPAKNILQIYFFYICCFRKKKKKVNLNKYSNVLAGIISMICTKYIASKIFPTDFIQQVFLEAFTQITYEITHLFGNLFTFIIDNIKSRIFIWNIIASLELPRIECWSWIFSWSLCKKVSTKNLAP